MLVFADGVMDHGVAVDLLAGFTDVDFKGWFREFPPHALFDQVLLLLCQPDHVFADALGFRQHDLHGVFFRHEDFRMIQFSFRQVTVQVIVPHLFCSGRNRRDQPECGSDRDARADA